MKKLPLSKSTSSMSAIQSISRRAGRDEIEVEPRAEEAAVEDAVAGAELAGDRHAAQVALDGLAGGVLDPEQVDLVAARNDPRRSRARTRRARAARRGRAARRRRPAA
jgi:hypothetical protein